VDSSAEPRPRPIAAIIVHQPWVDEREPSFTLFEDGTVIVRTGRDLVQSHLDADARDRFLARWVAAGFMDLPFYDDFTGAMSDQPSVHLFLLQGGRWKFGVYGGVDESGHTSSGEALPQAIAVALETAAATATADSRPWKPAKLRVLFTNCEQPLDDAIAWPARVPTPPAASLRAAAPGTGRMRMIGAYEHLVPAYHGPALEQVTAAEGQSGRPVRVGDVACSVDVLRQFPGERILADVEACAFARLSALGLRQVAWRQAVPDRCL
jgi:hypothetical protein